MKMNIMDTLKKFADLAEAYDSGYSAGVERGYRKAMEEKATESDSSPFFSFEEDGIHFCPRNKDEMKVVAILESANGKGDFWINDAVEDVVKFVNRDNIDDETRYFAMSAITIVMQKCVKAGFWKNCIKDEILKIK